MTDMAAFPSKTAPTVEKLRGGYYTPEPIADFLAEWVAPAGSRLLEPSCGDGNVLAALLRASPRAHAVGIELESSEASKARSVCPTAEVVTDDFFTWFAQQERGCWDGVAGNPPFIRFQHWVDPTRERAFDVMRYVGMRPTRLTNAWVPFVVASALSLRPGGHLGLVLPGELLQVGYAAELRGFLVDEFAELTVVTFKQLVFEGILQEVVLLLGVRGKGPAMIKVVQIDDVAGLPSAHELAGLPHAPALQHETEKWTKYFLEPGEIEALRKVRAAGKLTRLGSLADVDVGIVTGRNQFFVLSPSGAEARGIEKHVARLVSKSAHLRGTIFTDSDFQELEAGDGRCRLLTVDGELELVQEAALAAYVKAGESEGVHQGYKCSIRKRWWVVPSVWIPDAFLLRQIHDHPRIIANLAGATATDTIHRVRMLNGLSPSTMAAASINSATFAFSEVLGRSYGGGVLELEPREAEALPFPDPQPMRGQDVAKVDELLRARRLVDALDYVDRRLLIEGLGMSESLVKTLRAVWDRLRDRRLARGRKSSNGRTG